MSKAKLSAFFFLGILIGSEAFSFSLGDINKSYSKDNASVENRIGRSDFVWPEKAKIRYELITSPVSGTVSYYEDCAAIILNHVVGYKLSSAPSINAILGYEEPLSVKMAENWNLNEFLVMEAFLASPEFYKDRISARIVKFLKNVRDMRIYFDQSWPRFLEDLAAEPSATDFMSGYAASNYSAETMLKMAYHAQNFETRKCIKMFDEKGAEMMNAYFGRDILNENKVLQGIINELTAND